MKKKMLFFLILIMMVTSACKFTDKFKPKITETSITEINEQTQSPEVSLPTITEIPLETLAVTENAGSGSPSSNINLDYSASAYFDDRSTPASLILSLANAINRYEYLRAYSYWGSPDDFLGSLDDFSNQYAETTSVEVLFGTITSEGAAGSLYYTVASLLKFTHSDNSNSRSSACFVMRLPQPGNYGAPPITPMHIAQSDIQALNASQSDTDGLANACSGLGSNTGGLPSMPAEVEDSSDLSANNYIDNRSGAIDVVSSLFNALNRKEYVRAYSYWQNPSIAPGNYDAYAAGFSDTGVITASFGEVISDAGAGQWYYQVPVFEVVQTTTNTTQTFAGCYTLHLSNPGFQATYPFEPLGIKEGHFIQVANGSDAATLLATACD